MNKAVLGWAGVVALLLAVSAVILFRSIEGLNSTSPAFRQVGEASWYGPGFHGEETSSGETFNTHAMTAAHRTLPLGTSAQVTNLDNGRSVTVRINDRGPYVRGRVIDLSHAAARRLGMVKDGTTKVRIEAQAERER